MLKEGDQSYFGTDLAFSLGLRVTLNLRLRMGLYSGLRRIALSLARSLRSASDTGWAGVRHAQSESRMVWPDLLFAGRSPALCEWTSMGLEKAPTFSTLHNQSYDPRVQASNSRIKGTYPYEHTPALLASSSTAYFSSVQCDFGARGGDPHPIR